jgi:hypothetical protein
MVVRKQAGAATDDCQTLGRSITDPAPTSVACLSTISIILTTPNDMFSGDRKRVALTGVRCN